MTEKSRLAHRLWLEGRTVLVREKLESAFFHRRFEASDREKESAVLPFVPPGLNVLRILREHHRG